jgi:hypothetical protein
VRVAHGSRIGSRLRAGRPAGRRALAASDLETRSILGLRAGCHPVPRVLPGIGPTLDLDLDLWSSLAFRIRRALLVDVPSRPGRSRLGRRRRAGPLPDPR